MTDPSRQSPDEMPREPGLEDDRALLTAFREGRTDALRTVYRMYVQRVARYLHGGAGADAGHRMASAFDLENGLQEVFTRAFEPGARGSYDGLRPYEGYLVGIARNVLHERLRNREVATAEPRVDPVAEAGPAAAEAQVEDREVARLLAEFLAACAGPERSLYDLRFEQGLSQDEAAQRLGMTRIQLRRRERQLKLALLSFMKARGYLTGVRATGWGFGVERPS
jgi:RNA polymerase sigma factor (sigma-70 family)